jgi:hypothetical protein
VVYKWNHINVGFPLTCLVALPRVERLLFGFSWDIHMWIKNTNLRRWLVNGLFRLYQLTLQSTDTVHATTSQVKLSAMTALHKKSEQA